MRDYCVWEGVIPSFETADVQTSTKKPNIITKAGDGTHNRNTSRQSACYAWVLIAMSSYFTHRYIDDTMLEGIEVIDLVKIPDERGSFTEIMREDWNDFLKGERTMQSNLSISNPGMIRAWHRHVRGQFDIFVVIKGALKICAYNDIEERNSGELAEIVASGERPQAVKINGKFWHGTKCVSSVPSETVYYVTRLYERSNPDELRRPWNDSTIVPKSINGNKHDPRVGNTWDWNYPPHK